MALMAGILFATAFLVCGISSLVSPARIYPPNEGKAVGKGDVSAADLRLRSPLRPRPCARAATIRGADSCECAEPRGELKGRKTHTATGGTLFFVQRGGGGYVNGIGIKICDL